MAASRKNNKKGRVWPLAQKGFYVGKKKGFLAPQAVDLIAELVKEENTEWIESVSQIGI